MILAALVLLMATEGFTPLFDGKTMAGWKEAEFPRHGAVKVDDGALVLAAGAPLTGVNLVRADFPKSNYEVRFEAMKVRGGDFFASLTVPFQDSYCTFVTGGWGGDIVGLSSIDGWDASDNETRSYFTFAAGRWYAFRMMVRDERIQGFIDEKQVFDVEVGGRGIGLRPGDIKYSIPFGFAAYNTVGRIRNVEYRKL